MSGMGLRETKAKKIRKRILIDALQLFRRNGYEQTTMEAIAEAAEVSPSTLYRYFLTKDLILLDQLVGYDLIASFSLHAVNLPVEEALAKAILEWAKWQDTNAEELLLVRSLIDQNIMPRARVWDLLFQSVRDMNARLAEILHLPEDDLQVVLSVRLLFLVITFTVSDQWRAGAGKSSAVEIAKQVMRMLEENKVLIPRQAPRRSVTSKRTAKSLSV
jgi:AcrR family transcriptional regulator